MRFHFVMLLIVVLVSLSMHSMASATPGTGHAPACSSVDVAAPQAAR